MKYWIVRTYKDREAVGVMTDEELGDMGKDGAIIQNAQHVHIAQIEVLGDGTILVKLREGYPPKFKPGLVLEPVSESEYHTYKTFDLFAD